MCGLSLGYWGSATLLVGGLGGIPACEDDVGKLSPWSPNKGCPRVRTSKGIAMVLYSIPQALGPIVSSDSGWQHQTRFAWWGGVLGRPQDGSELPAGRSWQMLSHRRDKCTCPPHCWVSKALAPPGEKLPCFCLVPPAGTPELGNSCMTLCAGHLLCQGCAGCSTGTPPPVLVAPVGKVLTLLLPGTRGPSQLLQVVGVE